MKRILVVDESQEWRGHTAALLRTAGYSVVEAGSGSQALQATRADAPDLVLLDLNVRDAQGFELVRQLRALAGERYLPLLLLTATRFRGDCAHSSYPVFDGYLHKADAPHELLACVGSHLPGEG